MLNGNQAVREGRSEEKKQHKINHTHLTVPCEPRQLKDGTWIDRITVGPPCNACAAERDAFEGLLHEHGAHWLEERMHKLESYRAYNQKWPFDARKKVMSTEDVFEDSDGVVYVEGGNEETVFDRIASQEAINAMLVDLTPEERTVIMMTVDGWKPREIAKQHGEESSARVRQDKYSAMRKLGAPLNENMRRGKNE